MAASTIFITLAVVFTNHGVTAAEVCNTAVCTETASNIKKWMNMSANPCDDFYQFACGSWTWDNADKPFLKSLEYRTELMALLSNDEDFEDIPAVKNAKDYFKSCKNTDFIEEADINGTFAMLEKLGGWPVLGDRPGGNWDESKFDLTNLLITPRIYGFLRTMINMYPTFHPEDSTKYILHMESPRLGYESESYRNFSYSVAQMFGASKEQAENEMGRVMELESSLRDLYDNNNDRATNIVPVSDLDDYLSISQNGDLQFSMTNYVKGVMTGLSLDVNDADVVNVVYTSYYQKIMGVLQNYTKRDIANYVVWSYIYHSIQFLPRRFIDEAKLYGQGRYLRYYTESMCLRDLRTNLHAALEYIAVKKLYDVSMIPEVKQMVQGIRRAFDDSLNTLTWMDDATRESALEKHDDMVQLIGYNPKNLDTTWLNNKFKKVQMDKERFFDNRMELEKLDQIRWYKQIREIPRMVWSVNSPYDPTLQYISWVNAMAISTANLQPPYYDTSRPQSINYGGIGGTYAKEMTEAFDRLFGRTRGALGERNTWWSDATLGKYMAEVECLKTQYISFLNSIGLTSSSVSSFFDVPLVARSAGARTSFRAYQQWIAAKGFEEAVLPDLTYNNQPLNSNQLFFLKYTQNGCGFVNRNPFSISINGPPGDYSANHALLNMPEFAQAFSCEEGDNMNPTEKCNIF